MRPILLRIPFGGEVVAVGSYGAFYALAWLLAPAYGAWLASRRGLPWRRVAVTYYASLAAGVVGARLLDLFVAADFYTEDPSRVWGLSFQGFSLYGGLLVACVAAIVLSSILRLPLWRLADSAVPAIALGIVLMRTGCFLRGCCFGHVTGLPWGVTYPVGSMAWGHQVVSGELGLVGGLAGGARPVHPTQLYEMAGAVVIAAVATWVLPRLRAPEGAPFLVFATGFTLVRLGNGFLRVRQPVITAPEWFYPAFYSAVIVVLVALLVRRLREERAGRKQAREEPQPFVYP